MRPHQHPARFLPRPVSAEPTGTWAWRGCTVTPLVEGICKGDDRGEDIAQWFRGIVNWGATAWADSVVADIRAVSTKQGYK